MSDHQAPAIQSGLPFADRVREVGTDEPFRWLTAGWRDFRRSGIISLSIGQVFVAAGFLLTVGFYGISRDIEAGRGPSFTGAFLAWRANPFPLLGLGLALVLFLIVWMRLAAMIFAICFPYTTLDVQALLNAALFTQEGITFLAIGTIVGGFMATLAFTFGAFSLPLLLDRKVGILEAIATSAVAVVLNARAMAVWAALVVLFTAAGLAAGYVGLAVTLPLIGHATWHAYRAVIRA